MSEDHDSTTPDAPPGERVTVHPVDGGPRGIAGDHPDAVIARLRAVSFWLDEAFEVPGTNHRIGLDPLLGLLPVVGDAPTTAVSAYVVAEAVALGVPRETLARMLATLALDATVGSIPVIGTLFDAVWKANARNVALLEARTAAVDGVGPTPDDVRADRRFLFAVAAAVFLFVAGVGAAFALAVLWLVGRLGGVGPF